MSAKSSRCLYDGWIWIPNLSAIYARPIASTINVALRGDPGGIDVLGSRARPSVYGSSSRSSDLSTYAARPHTPHAARRTERSALCSVRGVCVRRVREQVLDVLAAAGGPRSHNAECRNELESGRTTQLGQIRTTVVRARRAKNSPVEGVAGPKGRLARQEPDRPKTRVRLRARRRRRRGLSLLALPLCTRTRTRTLHIYIATSLPRSNLASFPCGPVRQSRVSRRVALRSQPA